MTTKDEILTILSDISEYLTFHEAPIELHNKVIAVVEYLTLTPEILSLYKALVRAEHDKVKYGIYSKVYYGDMGEYSKRHKNAIKRFKRISKLITEAEAKK